MKQCKQCSDGDFRKNAEAYGKLISGMLTIQLQWKKNMKVRKSK